MSKILGIDVSSTTIGWGLLQLDGDQITYLNSGYIKPIKTGSIIERLASTRDKVKAIIDQYQPDYIGIEDIVKFMAGKSSANTIVTLTSFNRMITLLAYDSIPTLPKLFNVMSIRHGLKLDKILPKKELIPQLVAFHLNINFPYETTKKGKLKEENFDRADGIAVALYYAFQLTNRKKHNESKRSSKNSRSKK